MALTKKQVKQLRGLATKLNPLIQVGKNDLSENASVTTWSTFVSCANSDPNVI